MSVGLGIQAKEMSLILKCREAKFFEDTESLDSLSCSNRAISVQVAGEDGSPRAGKH
jgi:hypothetical protein